MKPYLLTILFFLTAAFHLLANPVNRVYISQIFYDSPLEKDNRNSPDNYNNGEYIQLYNPTSQIVDLSGWLLLGTMEYEQFQFPEGTVIAAEGSLLIAYRCSYIPDFTFSSFYSRKRPIDESKVIYQSSIILNNKGERLVLLDVHRNVVDAVVFETKLSNHIPPALACNGRNDNWSIIYSLHRTEVYEWDGQPTIVTNSGFVTGIATPLTAGTAQMVNRPSDPWLYLPQFIYLEGEIPAEGQVTPTGAFQYTVPIEVPAGRQGFQPQISLVYNSQSGLGLAGMGWNLAGLSLISTTQSTIHHNGDVSPTPTLHISALHPNSYNNLTLDGVRLIRPNNFINSYQLENDDKCRIEIDYASGQAVAAKVFLSNGTVCTYGLADNHSLRITEMEDLNGNYITYGYQYYNDANQYLINNISYGGNHKKSTGHFISLLFSYDIVSDMDVGMYYMNGSKYKMNRRLKQIESFVGSQRFRKYDLSYNSGYYSQLSHINLYSSEETAKLNPISFNYGKWMTNGLTWKPVINIEPYSLDINHENTIVFSGKFIPGSKNDAIVVMPKVRNNQLNLNKLFLYNGDEEPEVREHSFMVNLSDYKNFLTAKIDDNTPERDIIWTPSSIISNEEKLSIYVLKPHSSGDFISNKLKSYTMPIFSSSGYSFKIPKYFFTGDFNGDGKEEIFALEYYLTDLIPSTFSAYILDLNDSGTVPVFSGLSPFPIGKNDIVFTLDYNGDGKTDIGVIKIDGIYILSFIKEFQPINQKWPYKLQIIAFSSDIKLSDFYGEERKKDGETMMFTRQLLVGDINGDGKTDIIVTSRCAKYNQHATLKGQYTTIDADGFSKWTQYLSTGQSPSAEGAIFDVSTWTDSRGVNIDGGTFLQDINGDGRPDIVTSDINNIYLRYAVGEKFSSTITTISKTEKGGVVTTVDLCAPNNSRYLAHIVNGKIYRFNYQRDEQQEALLTSVTGSHGLVTTLDYARMDQTTDDVYTPDANQSFPYRTLTDAKLWLVQNVKIGAITNNHYSYKGAVAHLQGFGFCGMQRVDIYDAIRNLYSYQVFDPLRRGVLVQETSPTQTINNVWELQENGTVNQRKVRARLLKQTITDHLTGFISTNSFTYDSYGLPTMVEKQVGGEVTEKTSYSYYNQLYTGPGGKWIIGLLLTEDIAISRNGDSYSQINNYTYNNNHWLLQKRSFTNSQLTSQEQFTYDDGGLLLTQSSKVYQSPEILTVTNSYTSDGRFLKQRTDASGKTTVWEYNDLKGVPVKETDYKGNITTYSYDIFGRPTGANYPDGTQSARSISRVFAGDGSYNTHQARTVVVETCTGKPMQKTYYDVHGREVASMVQGFDGTQVWTNKLYNNKGFLAQTSAPHFGEPSRWTVYTYDQYGRILKINQPSGKQSLYAYNGASTKITENGVDVTKTCNALGEIIKVTDPAGSILYNYRANGQPSSIQAPDGSITTFEYDSYGRRIKITDPSAGEQSYTYNPAGNMASQTNAKGQTVSMTYNKFGQITVKNMPEFNVAYIYDDDQQLIAIEADNGSSTNYTYDNLGRVLSAKEVVNNEEIEKNYTYNQGKLATVTYSPLGNIPLNYEYNAYGYLNEIKHGANNIWKLEQKNALGQKEKERLGNDVINTYTYTEDGLPLSIATANQQWQHKETYVFDPVKKLLNRRSVLGGLTEDFTYDPQKRLTGYGITTSGSMPAVVNYNTMGSIVYKTDAGQMNYNLPSKPYAISQIIDQNPNIPLAQQDVTYTSFSRPATIEEGDYKAVFDYNSDGDRTTMHLYNNSALSFTRYYLGGNYEKEIDDTGNTIAERLYIGSSPYSAPAVYSNEGGVWKLYYLHRDYLGSLRLITDEEG
ncbi:MAG: lamin tail domain-containing protein, partial [Prevotellaceae bacterium]|nr:lamin tail domain-containing protein [Prevotellaceae bacterium]